MDGWAVVTGGWCFVQGPVRVSEESAFKELLLSLFSFWIGGRSLVLGVIECSRHSIEAQPKSDISDKESFTDSTLLCCADSDQLVGSALGLSPKIKSAAT